MEAKTIKNIYVNWVHENFDFEDLGKDKVRVQTPYLDQFSDGIEFLITEESGKYRITDEQYNTWHLRIHGHDVLEKDSSLYTHFIGILKRYNVKVDKQGVLYKEVNKNNLVEGIHDMVKVVQEMTTLEKNKK